MPELSRGPVLVTGAAGYIGRHVVQQLAARGHQVTAVDNLSSPNSGDAPAAFAAAGVDFRRCDVTDSTAFGPLVREHPVIMHLASIVGVQAVISQPRAVLDQLAAVATIVDEVTPDHVLLLASSSDIYGLHSVLHDNAPIREDDLTVLEPPQVLRWSYAHMKALAESVFAGSPARAVGIRIFNCYGPGLDFPQPRRVVPTFATRIVQGQPLQISGDGSQRRTYCHVDDVVEGMLAAVEYIAGREPGAYEAINIGNPDGQMSVIDLAKTMARLAVAHSITDREVEILTDHHLYSASFNDSWHRAVDISKARELLGFQPRVPLEEGLVQVLSYVARHADQLPPPAVPSPRGAAVETNRR
jgi:UDP-glucose 4-epimerase